MIENNRIHDELIKKLNKKFLELDSEFEIPPPVFIEMHGEVIEVDEINNRLKIQFPVLQNYSNPFGNMQGGMVAAAIDNTFGPLSMLVAPLSFTRKLEIKFKKPINNKSLFIMVEANVRGMSERELILGANVTNTSGDIMAIANAVHRLI